MVRSNARSLNPFCLLRNPKQHVLWCSALKRYEIGETKVLLEEFTFSYMLAFQALINFVIQEMVVTFTVMDPCQTGHLLDICWTLAVQIVFNRELG